MKVWAPKFLAEIVAGRDPAIPPDVPQAAIGVTVAEFLDTYYANYVEAEGLRDPTTIRGRLKAIEAVLGDQPVTALEKPAEVLRFKAASRKGREVATVNRALSTLRAAINWGRFQDHRISATTPFHRFGVTIKTKEETKRDRRTGLQEEQALLAACRADGRSRTQVRRFRDARPNHRRLGDVLSPRRDAADSESARRLGAAPDRHSRSPCEGCGESPHPIRPARTHGARPQAARSLGPNAYVFASPAGEFVANFKTAWESLLLIANGHETKRARPGGRVDRAKLRQIDLHWHDLRHEGACRLLSEAVDIRRSS